MRLSSCVAGLLGIGLLTTSSSVFAGKPSQPIPITECGQALDVAGAEYVFGSGLLNCCGASGATVTISANRIHLNTAGANIVTVCSAVAIIDGVSDILIDGGGRLVGGGGLVVGKDRHIVVRDVTLGGEDDLGGSMAGVQINRARDVTLTGCQIFGSQSIALQMNGASGVTAINNNISGAFGVYGTVDKGVFANNSVTVSADAAARGRGIAVTGRGNLIANNSLNLPGLGSPTRDDIGIIVSSHSRVLGNIVNQFFIGVELSGDFNRVIENLITGRSMGTTPLSINGIETDTGATHNSIEKNAVSTNQADLYESNGPPCVNLWRNNVHQTSGGAVACIH
jgi:hypothetical protein